MLHNKERHSKFNSESSKTNPVKPNDGTSNSNPAPITAKPSNTHQVDGNAELFRILPVIVHKNGESVETYAFFDEGSSYTLMERETANQLRVKGTAETICLLWTNGVHRQEDTENVNIEISGTNEFDTRHQLRSVNVVEDLGLAAQSVDPEDLE